MQGDLQADPPRSPIWKRIVAALVLLAVVVLAFHFVIGLIMAVFWVVVAIAAIGAVLWAAKTLL